ncbi:molybdopterin synthase catalytic subunit [Vulcanococcus limneticus]|uniref:molybdopterin synthase catalytic subunit n=1 Tax=Vulcanococcus limneticus TaxID=2170428 RepID=UPI00398BFC98
MADAGPALVVVRLHAEPFDPLALLAGTGPGGGSGAPPGGWCGGLGLDSPAAEAHFIGRVRGTAAGGGVLEAMELEYYPGMTERQLQVLAQACAARHGVAAVLVAHRVGRALPGEALVLVAVAADRRGPAQRCGGELLEALKHEAPFWKREWSGGVGTWVEGNTPLG